MDEKIRQLVKMGKTLQLLYVEDNESVRVATLELFNRFFTNITVAVDGEEGLQKFKEAEEHFFDVIITDINMPKMTGIEMIEEIRAEDKNISILVLSAHNEINYFTETIKLGIDGYLLKPIDLQQFIDTLSGSLEKIVLRRENEEYKNGLESKILEKTQELEYRLYHDDLTDLKNRTSLIHDLEGDAFSALLLIDVDRFHNINEIFGMEGGNCVIQQFADFLRAFCLDKSYEVYRLHGDSFVLRSTKDYLALEEYEKEVPQLLEELSHFAAYIKEADDYVEIDITIGISFEKQNALEKAEVALKYAQSTRRNYIAYNRSIDTTKQLKDARFWRSEIKHAILDNRIVPFFQPIVDREQNVVKYEVLMRLEREKNGQLERVSPFFFLKVAKQTKQYEKLTEIMIEKSFSVMKDYDVDFSLNLSFDDIGNQGFSVMLKRLINQYQVGERLIFEIVESEDLSSYESVQLFVREMKAMGVRIAIDDFGSGFSNYKRIFDIAPSFLKIDGSLIKNIDTDKNSYELVKSIVSLTRALDITTIGEYVYSKEIFDICYDLGVEEFQGFYFSEPIDAEQLAKNERRLVTA
ncbi:MAG: EAL domain-containing protein [Epsilonproteobacteria bacterium]|nr:EAL domain-containing protein [Campylobacterota bacterium]